MEGRKRTVQVKFYVTEEERGLIREKMKLIPTRNMAAYLRKMAIEFSNHIANCTNFRCYIQPKPDFILPKIGIF